MTRVWRAAAPAVLLLLAANAPAQAAASPPDTSFHVAVGGFVDAYYAYDFDRPPTLDRVYTTTAARHDEFNVNLAFVDLVLTGPRVRGRLAVQFGTSVQANYAGEPHVGTLSGPDVSRYLQEATLGYQVGSRVWLDAGVFLAPFGSENWISRDNWTYTRSLIADNSPYYEAGVKATWQVSPRFAAQLHVMNGWQNISETNSDKALGVRLDYALTPRVALAYDAFVGNEAPDSAPSRLRVFHEGIVTATLTPRLQVKGTLDYGTQRRAAGSGASAWHGWAVVARLAVAPRVAVAARAEAYADPHQVIVATGLPYGLQATGQSLTLDVTPVPRILWRVETRRLEARDPVFPEGPAPASLTRGDVVLVSSVALTF